MRIAVFAPEGCGNALSKSLLLACTGLQAEGASLPFERAGKACRYEACHGMGLWPIPCDVRKYDWYLLLTRSAVHSCFSVWRRMGRRNANPNGHWTRGYTDEGIVETIIWQQLAARRMIDMMNRIEVPHMLVSYGDLTNTPGAIMRRICDELDREWHSGGPDVQNRNNNRWKDDEVFSKTWNRYKEMFP